MQINFKREVGNNFRRPNKVNATAGGGFGAMGSNNIADLNNLNDS